MELEYISQTALDQMVTDDLTQMLKAAVPYLPPAGRQILSVYAKMQELSNTISIFRHAENMQVCTAENTDVMDMIQDIRKYSAGKNRQQLDQLTSMLAMIQIIQIMNE